MGLGYSYIVFAVEWFSASYSIASADEIRHGRTRLSRLNPVAPWFDSIIKIARSSAKDMSILF